MSGPLDLTPWQERLADLPNCFRLVGLAADLAAIQGALKVTPQAFVVPVSDSPASRAGAGNSVVSQNVNAVVAVVVAVANARSSQSGAAASVDIQPYRRAVLASLLGWRPPGASLAIQYAGGQLLEYRDATVWFSDRYTTAYFLREQINE